MSRSRRRPDRTGQTGPLGRTVSTGAGPGTARTGPIGAAVGATQPPGRVAAGDQLGRLGRLKRLLNIGRVKHHRPMTLRRRLVLLSIALTVTISVVIGLFSVLSLRLFLEQRLDEQLLSAMHRSREAIDRPPGGYDDATDHTVGVPPLLSAKASDRQTTGPNFLSAPGQGENTLGAEIQSDGTVSRAAVLNATGGAVALSSAQKALISQVVADQKPQTLDLGGDLGVYRVIAQTVEDGDSTVIQVTGLPMNAVNAAVLRLAAVVTGVSVVGLITLGVLGGYLVRRSLRPLNRVAAVASGVTALPLHQGPAALPVRVPEQDTDTSTEVGQVGAALNTLLGHVDGALQARNASESRMRRFIADASHELRTPLASIRGYAELTRRSPEQIPLEVAHALSRVESEAIRMSGLVEELLMLARLDGGRQVAHEPVDMSHLLVDRLSDAHAAGPGHRWKLNLPEIPVIAIGDEPQLHQVVANLLANARVHTPPGTTVEASLRLETTADGKAEAVFTVTDNGPGIAPDLLPEVFERFARGDNSRSRASGSTGLGLSIVSAVVAAHGGTVGVTSRPGATCFSVRLPAEPFDPAATEAIAEADPFPEHYPPASGSDRAIRPDEPTLPPGRSPLRPMRPVQPHEPTQPVPVGRPSPRAGTRRSPARPRS